MMTRSITKSIVLILLTAVSGTIFMGCESKPEMPMVPTVTVMKFKQPEYKNYVLANCMEGDEYIGLLRNNTCDESVICSGASPYWNLQEEWLLVDWRWENFPYDAGLTLLTEQTWEKWMADTILTSRKIPAWFISKPHVLQPVEKILYIKPANLAKYLNKSYMLDDIYTVIERKFIDTNTTICDHSEWGDSIWAMLQNDLSVAIENGELEHINDDKYNPYVK